MHSLLLYILCSALLAKQHRINRLSHYAIKFSPISRIMKMIGSKTVLLSAIGTSISWGIYWLIGQFYISEDLQIDFSNLFQNLMSQSQIKERKIKSKPSFNSKNSLARVNPSGHFSRPIHKIFSNDKDPGMTDKLHSLMDTYIPKDIPSIERAIVHHVEYTLARTRFDFKQSHCYQAVAHSVRDRLIQSFNDTHRAFNRTGTKKIYYLSLQFLIGRCLQNALINLNLEDQYSNALKDLGYNLESIYEKEVDAALGNGGLGRLAACFLDSLATLNYPAWGYGIRYDYGIFKQLIKNGYQVEVPDYWLSNGNPWEIQRVDVEYKVKFYGRVRKAADAKGVERSYWQDCETIIARAYDTPIPGYATFNTIGLRLWKSLPLNEFDLFAFNRGEYYNALEARQRAEYITSVLYPNDSTDAGKELRLKQQYLLVSATIQDILRRHKAHSKQAGRVFTWENFPKEASIQLNDTHPALGIVEFLRILVDEEHLDQQKAWEIIYQTFSYTNHTVLPQALEKWSVELIGKLLPRHLELIYLINHYWLNKVSKKYPGNYHKLSVLSLVEESTPKKIRMANLCVIGSHKVNGVAFLHSQLLKQTLFKDFYEFFPTKFINMTNGVTTRRWVMAANSLLADLYTEYLKTDQWVLDMSKLRELEVYASDPEFQSKWQAIKLNNKRKLAEWIHHNCKIVVNQNSLFDMQVKRIHEYKRQFMNILYVIYRYLTIKEMTPEQRKSVVPRTVMFAGKSAPGYATAKNIIKLINEVSYVLNNDDQTKSLLKVIFLPNYSVSNAEIIIPASELSQHISTAGTEASGTSNMKFVMNGGLIIGTMDGANVEIYEEVGQENIFIFGARVEAIEGLKHKMCTSSFEDYAPPQLKKVIHAIRVGTFGERDLLMGLAGTIMNNNDWYLVGADFVSYIEAQDRVDKAYLNREQWTKKSILNALRTGKFSSDRTIREYAKEIWNINPLKVTEEM